MASDTEIHLVAAFGGDSPLFGVTTPGRALTHYADGRPIEDGEKRAFASAEPHNFQLVDLTPAAVKAEPAKGAKKGDTDV